LSISYSGTANGDYITDTLHLGTVTITRFDTINRIYSGTFEGTVADKSSIKHITSGRFDLKLHILLFSPMKTFYIVVLLAFLAPSHYVMAQNVAGSHPPRGHLIGTYLGIDSITALKVLSVMDKSGLNVQSIISNNSISKDKQKNSVEKVVSKRNVTLHRLLKDDQYKKLINPIPQTQKSSGKVAPLALYDPNGSYDIRTLSAGQTFSDTKHNIPHEYIDFYQYKFTLTTPAVVSASLCSSQISSGIFLDITHFLFLIRIPQFSSQIARMVHYV